jgi:2'-5' RNA ligase
MARVRTFIAIGLDPILRDRCVALQQKLARADASVKWVERENLHVTLLFLGEILDRELPRVCAAVATVASDTEDFTFSLQAVGCFPNARRPRVVWVGLGQGQRELIALHDALEPPLLELGCYRREERQYTPHITLGRVQGEGNSGALAQAISGYNNWQGGEMDAREILTLSSELTREGPEYTVLSRVKLKKPAQCSPAEETEDEDTEE